MTNLKFEARASAPSLRFRLDGAYTQWVRGVKSHNYQAIRRCLSLIAKCYSGGKGSRLTTCDRTPCCSIARFLPNGSPYDCRPRQRLNAVVNGEFLAPATGRVHKARNPTRAASGRAAPLGHSWLRCSACPAGNRPAPWSRWDTATGADAPNPAASGTNGYQSD
jgi:hypothetical protein